MKRLPINFRAAVEAIGSDEVPVILIEIRHPELAAPIRLSTDNAELIEETPEGQIRGTRSSWRGADPATEPFLCMAASAVFPSALEQSPEAGSLVLDNLHPEMARLILSFQDIATISLAAVMADVPDIAIRQSCDLDITSATITGGEITLRYGFVAQMGQGVILRIQHDRREA
ncbi:hypothetical protein [Salipiger aestuarii]|jgi:hypothetical protein|uniref:hypothetical protein n=1 Tax=Salipiger aestuarii TaxID=568098 RepID=UPI001239886D|nr:hypothetical protein [Salipiger aestuarii]